MKEMTATRTAAENTMKNVWMLSELSTDKDVSKHICFKNRFTIAYFRLILFICLISYNSVLNKYYYIALLYLYINMLKYT